MLLQTKSKPKYFWDLFMLFVNTYVVLAAPFNLVVAYVPTYFSILVECGLVYALFTDIVIKFSTPIKVNREYVLDRKLIAVNYFKSYFFLDFISAIPFYLLFHIFSSSGEITTSLGVISLLRMLRVFRLIDFVKKLQDPRIFNHPLLRFGFFLFWILLFAHWVACGWLLLGTNFTKDEKWLSYLKSLYWTITTLTTVGYGDFIPHTTSQMVYTIIIMMLGAGVYGYVIGNVAGLITNVNEAKTNYLRRIDNINTFFRFRKIPLHLQEKVLDYQGYLWESRLGYDENVVLENLPYSLKVEISMFLNRGIIQKVPLFKNASEDFIREIASALCPVVFTPGDYIIRKGEVANVMYFINRGFVDIVSDDSTQIFKRLHEGDFFGEMALVLSMPRASNIRASGYCDLYALSKESLENVIYYHPEFKQQLDDVVRQRLKKTTSLNRREKRKTTGKRKK